MNHKRTLALIFILALLLRLFFVFAIPVFQKPDENMHFEYIEFVAENKKLPVGGNFLSELIEQVPDHFRQHIRQFGQFYGANSI